MSLKNSPPFTSPGGRRTILAPVLGFMTAASVVSAPALAQTLNSGQGASSSVQVATPVPYVSSEPPLPSPESLFPELFGARPFLTDHGIAVLFDTVDELAGNITGDGGPRPAGRNSTQGGASIDGQVGFETDINWERLAGITGFSTNTIIVARYGGLPASELVGDSLNPTQEVYGAGGNVVAHLVQVFGTESLAGGRFSVSAGRIPLDDFFAASPLYCVYESNAICGNPKNFVDNYSHSSYPDANWAVRTFISPIPDYYIQGGIYFTSTNIYNPGLGFRSGFNFDTSYIHGQAFPVEIGWTPKFGDQALPGHYKLGYVYDHNPHASDYFDAQGSAILQTGLPPKIYASASTVYLLADQTIFRNGPGTTAGGLTLLGGASYNDPQTSTRAYQFFGGAQDLGFWQARPFDQINGIATYQRVSGLLGKAEGLGFSEGLPLLDIPGGASGVQTWTATFELNYAIHVYRGVTFAPDFQYMIRPNAQSNLPDAAFLGFKAHVEFF